MRSNSAPSMMISHKDLARDITGGGDVSSPTVGCAREPRVLAVVVSEASCIENASVIE